MIPTNLRHSTLQRLLLERGPGRGQKRHRNRRQEGITNRLPKANTFVVGAKKRRSLTVPFENLKNRSCSSLFNHNRLFRIHLGFQHETGVRRGQRTGVGCGECPGDRSVDLYARSYFCTGREPGNRGKEFR